MYNFDPYFASQAARQAIVDTDEDDEVREVKIAKEVKRDDVL